MEVLRSGAVYYQRVIGCFLLYFSILIIPVSGYSLKNCTVRESLHDPNMIVICSTRNLQAIPDDIPCKARTLDIAGNKISVISKLHFKDLTVVNVLNMSNNRICFIEDGSFLDLVSLRELKLAHNRLSNLSDFLFQGLSNLSVLRLDNNLIKTIAPSSFQVLSNLKTLNLTGNQLHSLKELQTILQFTSHLQELFIGTNRFTSFQSQEISNTTMDLRVLDLSRNPLGIFRITDDVLPHLQTLNLAYCGQNGSMEWSVPDSSFLRSVSSLFMSGVNMSLDQMTMVLQTFNSSLKQLKLYDIGGDRITALTDVACRIPTLRVFSLRQNKISLVTKELLQSCNQLTEVDLSDNVLTKLSNSSFISMVQLDTLVLFKNSLSSVPNFTRNLETLHSLDLSFNRIEKLGCFDFANLKGLNVLLIFSNKIRNIESCIFQPFRNLTVLSLGTNAFLTLSGAFKDGFLPNLEILDLRNGVLQTISKGDFKSLESLTTLIVYNNKISTIEDGAFEGLVNLRILNLASNSITQHVLRDNVFRGLTQLKELDLSSNRITYETHDKLNHPPFSLLSSLNNLIIFSQHPRGMDNLPSNFLEGLKSLLVLNARNLNIRSIHPDSFSHTPQLMILDLSLNNFKFLTPEMFYPIPGLQKLYMSKDKLTSLDFLIGTNLTQLRLLQIMNNDFTSFSKTELSSLPALTYLNLENNVFNCDCSNSWFINWTKTDNLIQVVNAYNYDCNNPVNLRGTKFLAFDTSYCLIDLGFVCFVSTTSLILLTLIVSYMYHVLRLHVFYAYYLFLAYLHDSKRRRTAVTNRAKYDAFVSYNAHNEPWVVGELLPKLEGDQGWRLCLHHRDFLPGKPIMDNITDAIYGSCKTICVISRRYLESEWCSREIQMASFRLFDEQKDVLILVFLEDIPVQRLSPYYRMRKLVKKRTYLSWPRAGEHKGVFWEKLRVALETRTCGAEEKPILSGVKRQ